MEAAEVEEVAETEATKVGCILLFSVVESRRIERFSVQEVSRIAADAHTVSGQRQYVCL